MLTLYNQTISISKKRISTAVIQPNKRRRIAEKGKKNTHNTHSKRKNDNDNLHSSGTKRARGDQSKHRPYHSPKETTPEQLLLHKIKTEQLDSKLIDTLLTTKKEFITKKHSFSYSSSQLPLHWLLKNKTLTVAHWDILLNDNDLIMALCEMSTFSNGSKLSPLYQLLENNTLTEGQTNLILGDEHLRQSLCEMCTFSDGIRKLPILHLSFQNYNIHKDKIIQLIQQSVTAFRFVSIDEEDIQLTLKYKVKPELKRTPLFKSVNELLKLNRDSWITQEADVLGDFSRMIATALDASVLNRKNIKSFDLEKTIPEWVWHHPIRYSADILMDLVLGDQPNTEDKTTQFLAESVFTTINTIATRHKKDTQKIEVLRGLNRCFTQKCRTVGINPINTLKLKAGIKVLKNPSVAYALGLSILFPKEDIKSLEELIRPHSNKKQHRLSSI